MYSAPLLPTARRHVLVPQTVHTLRAWGTLFACLSFFCHNLRCPPLPGVLGEVCSMAAGPNAPAPAWLTAAARAM